MENEKAGRRYDSLALIFQGSDKCAAVCCLNGEFLIATNQQEKSDMVITVENYLRALISIGRKMARETDLENVENLKNQIQPFYQAVEKAYSEVGTPIYNNRTGAYEKKPPTKNKQNLFKKALDKVQNAILATCLGEKNPFPEEAVNALEHEATTRFLEEEKGVHAELKIAGKILDDETLHTSSHYVGVSKKCCKKCEMVIEAINEVHNKMIEPEYEASNPPNLILTRGKGHQQPYGATIPAFLTEPKHAKIKELFLQKSGFTTLEEAFETQNIDDRAILCHPPSPSPEKPWEAYESYFAKKQINKDNPLPNPNNTHAESVNGNHMRRGASAPAVAQ